MKTDEEQKATNDKQSSDENILFRISPASLGTMATAIHGAAMRGALDYSWLNSLASGEAARATDFSWLAQFAGRVPPHEEMMRFAEAFAARAQEAVAGMEMLANLVRVSVTADFKVLSDAAIAGQILQAMQVPEVFRRDDRPIIDASDVEM